jgi:hypothetical protein
MKDLKKLLSDPNLLKSLEKEQKKFQNPQEKKDAFVKTEPKRDSKTRNTTGKR